MTRELALVEEEWSSSSNLTVALKVVEVESTETVVPSLKLSMVASVDARLLTNQLLTIRRHTSPVESIDPTQTTIDPLTTILSTAPSHRAVLELLQSLIDWLGH